MYRPVLVTAPAANPITLTEVKAQLDISYSDKDTYLTSLITAAVSYLDGWTGILGRCLVEQTWRQDYDYFYRVFDLPLAPVIAITSVKYDDASAVEQTVSASNYELVTRSDGSSFVRMIDDFSVPSIDPESGPSVRITYTVGYPQSGGSSTVPAAIKQAMLLLIRHWFDNPSAVVVGVSAQPMPMAVDALLAPWRRVRF